jgi:hypothetical protein
MLRKRCRPQAGRCVEALFGEGAADAKLDLLKLGERRGVRDLAVLRAVQMLHWRLKPMRPLGGAGSSGVGDRPLAIWDASQA